VDKEDLMGRIGAHSVCGVLVLDKDDMIMFSSGVWDVKLPTDPANRNGHMLGKLDLPVEVLSQIRIGSKRSLSSGQQVKGSVTVRSGGSTHQWLLTFSPSYGDHGHGDAVIITAYDAGPQFINSDDEETDLRVFEQNRLPLLPGSVVVLSRDDLTFKFVNQTAMASMHTVKEDIIGRKLTEVLKNANPSFLAAFREVASTGDTIIRTESGSTDGLGVRYYRWMITPTNRDGVESITFTIVDMTEQVDEHYREMSKGMFQERQMLMTIIDTMPVGMVIANRDGSIWHSNMQSESLTPHRVGGGAPDPGLDTWLDSDDHQMGIEDWPLYRALYSYLTTRDKEIRLYRPTGEVKTLLASAAPLRSDDGVLIGAISVFMDITELKSALEKLTEQAEELKRSNAELQQFAYVASHDLKEPLRMVVNYVQLLKKNYRDRLDPKGIEYIEYASEGALRMRAMIDELLDYSRVGMTTEQFDPVDMDKLLEEVIEDLGAAIDESGAYIKWSKLPTVTAVRRQMIILMENLISNSIKFRNVEAPHIAIDARVSGSFWEFSVKDNGIGIDTNYSERLFKMFQRLHTREEYPGTGMGLALARRIVERHGGQIWFDSKVGEGATFYFTLPIESNGYNDVPSHEYDET
jgi:signal transduction histidine kinase